MDPNVVVALVSGAVALITAAIGLSRSRGGAREDRIPTTTTAADSQLADAYIRATFADMRMEIARLREQRDGDERRQQECDDRIRRLESQIRDLDETPVN